MPSFLVQFSAASKQAVESGHAEVFSELMDCADPPVVGTRRLVDHQFSALEEEALEPLMEAVAALGAKAGEIDAVEVPGDAGLVLTVFSFRAEDPVLLDANFMTARVLEMMAAAESKDAQYDGWWVSYEPRVINTD